MFCLKPMRPGCIVNVRLNDNLRQGEILCGTRNREYEHKQIQGRTDSRPNDQGHHIPSRNRPVSIPGAHMEMVRGAEPSCRTRSLAPCVLPEAGPAPGTAGRPASPHRPATASATWSPASVLNCASPGVSSARRIRFPRHTKPNQDRSAQSPCRAVRLLGNAYRDSRVWRKACKQPRKRLPISALATFTFTLGTVWL